MKSIAMITLILSSILFAGESKYSVGDCITPTDRVFSWFGYYARVTSVEEGEDALEGKSIMYLMNFMRYDTKANRFVATLIDNKTKKVKSSFCE